MKIIDIFKSIQGEGMLAGVPTTFVRLAGCNCKCSWCDQKEAWDDTNIVHTPTKMVCDKVEKLSCSDVCFTGGEPFLQIDAVRKVCRQLTDVYRFSIETNGSIYDPFPGIGFMSFSPKLQFWPHDTFIKWMELCYSFSIAHQIKVVCNDINECKQAAGLVAEFNEFMLIQPRWETIYLRDIISFCVDNNIRLSTQMHKYLGVL